MDEHHPPRLRSEALTALHDLVERMGRHQGAWKTVKGGERTGPTSFTMPSVVMDEVAQDAMTFLYDHDLIISFAWPDWDEGREIFRGAEFTSLDRQTVLKLLTAVARNDRFMDGAWVRIFEDGSAQALFERLLKIESATSS